MSTLHDELMKYIAYINNVTDLVSLLNMHRSSRSSLLELRGIFNRLYIVGSIMWNAVMSPEILLNDFLMKTML